MSDLHLGADLKRTGFAWLRGVATLDREFGAFLDWYSEHPEEGLPWRLIVNGDMVDFINVTLLPSDDEAAAAGFEVTEAERRFGLHGEEAKIAWMVERVVDRHHALFEKLAAFVSRGNEIAIVRGNHDVEFHFPRVQARFRELLAGVAGVEGEARDAFLSRIAFLPWFYYEPGAIFVEHGHQYDDYSSFEYVLAPVAASSPEKVDLPISHFAIRYLANAFPNISTDDKDGWTMADYARFLVSGKAGGIFALLAGYFAMLGRIGISWIRRRLTRDHDIVRAHHGALELLAQELRLPPEMLRRLHRLHRGTALNSLFQTMQCFYVDRMALVVGGLLVTLFLLADFSLSALAFALAAVCVVLVIAGLVLLARARAAEIPPKLVRASQAIAAIVGVPLVVMGHSHRACVVPTPDQTAHYVNTGTWIPPHGEKTIGFTHLRVRRAPGAAAGTVGGRGSLDAELRRWEPGSGPKKLG